jgi:tetratricopeptide (TPR) repeat protein
VRKRWQLTNFFSWLVMGALLNGGARAHGDDSVVANASSWTDAHRYVERAEALFRARNYEAALTDYSRAYALLENYRRRYVVLHNIAVCYERLFRYDEAVRFYERYLREGGTGAEDFTAVTAALDVLRDLLATLEVRANVRGELWVDDRRMAQVPARVQVPAGRHLIEVRAVLHESARRELTVEARSFYRLRLALAPLSNYRGLDRGYFIGSAGVTAALIVTAIVLGAETLAAHGQARDDAAASMHLRTMELERDQSTVRRWALGTDLSTGAAALFGTVTLLLFFLTDWHAEVASPLKPTGAPPQ